MKFHSRWINTALFITALSSLAACNNGGGDSAADNTSPSASDTQSPTVVSTSPANAATGVAFDAVITVNFSEAMDCATLTTATFTLNGAAAVNGNVNCNGSSATFTPSASLAATTAYTATVTTGVRDTAGNALAANYFWSFTTAAAPVAASRVVFGSAGNPSDLFIINDDGTGRVTLASPPDDHVFNAVTPGGRAIYQRTPVVGGSIDIYSV